jgi:tetratricopeptide (TPR) repeat protein
VAASGAPAAAAGAPAAPPLDMQRAADLERQANAQPADAAVRAELGNVYYDGGRYDLAVPWYEASIKIDPKNVTVSTDLAVCYYNTNQTDKALTQIDHSLSVDPRHAKTLLNQGIIRAFGKNDLKGAVDSWEKVVAVAPGTEEAKHAQQALTDLKAAHPGGAAATAAGSGGRSGGLEPRP